jgi:hypothetical protein
MERQSLFNVSHQEADFRRCDLSAAQAEALLRNGHPELFSVVEVIGDELGERLNGAEWLAQRQDVSTS